MRFCVPWLSPKSASTPQKSKAGHQSRSDKIVRQARHVSEANIIWWYSLALLAVAAAAGLRLASHRVLGLQVPYWSFTVAVIVAAWVGGRGPSLAATALSALAADWFFVAPTHSFAIAGPSSAWGLALFVAVRNHGGPDWTDDRELTGSSPGGARKRSAPSVRPASN